MARAAGSVRTGGSQSTTIALTDRFPVRVKVPPVPRAPTAEYVTDPEKLPAAPTISVTSDDTESLIVPSGSRVQISGNPIDPRWVGAGQPDADRRINGGGDS